MDSVAPVVCRLRPLLAARMASQRQSPITQSGEDSRRSWLGVFGNEGTIHYGASRPLSPLAGLSVGFRRPAGCCEASRWRPPRHLRTLRNVTITVTADYYNRCIGGWVKGRYR